MSELIEPTTGDPSLASDALLCIQKRAANQLGYQILYEQPLLERNPYDPGTPEHEAHHFGYELEKIARGRSQDNSQEQARQRR